MTPKTDVADKRRQQILTAAAACFASKGFHRTTMDEIVQACGLSKGSLYWYFDSKKAIFLALAEQFFTEIGDNIVSEDSVEVPASTRLAGNLESFAQLLQSQTALLPLMLEIWADTFKDEDVKRLMIQIYGSYRDALSGIIRHGVATGEFRPVDTDMAASVIIAAIDGLMLQWLLSPDTIDITEALKTTTEITLRGLVANGGPHQT